MSRLLMNESVVLVAVMALRVTALLAVAWLLHVALRRRHPWWQIVLWRSVIVGTVAILAASPFLPGWGPSLGSAPSVTHRRPAKTIENSRFESPRPAVVDPGDSPDVSEPEIQPATADATVPDTVLENAPQSAKARSQARVLTIETAAAGLYLLVAGVLLIRLGWQFRQLRTVLRCAVPANEHTVALAAAMARALGISLPPRVVVSSLTSGPLAAGIWRPVIVLPQGLTEQLSAQELQFVLAHECSHFAGCDLPWALAARLVRTILWPHPLVWRLPDVHRFACDVRCDAIAAAGDVDKYSTMLANLALSLQLQSAAPMALAFLEKSETLRRINLLVADLGAKRPSRVRRLCAAFGILIVFGLLGTVGINALHTRTALGQTEPEEETQEIQVTVLDPDEDPVEGAEVLIETIEVGHGRMYIPRDIKGTTDGMGIAVISFPAQFQQFAEDNAQPLNFEFVIRHPEFVRSNPRGTLGQPLRFLLQHGRRVNLSAKDSVSGQRITKRLFVMDRFSFDPIEVRWKQPEEGVYQSHPLDLDIKHLLVIALREDGTPLFSDPIDLTGYPVGSCRIDDVPLSPGARVTGRLSANVPRPVKNGLVKLRVDYATDEQSKYTAWDDTAKIHEDGTFEFASVPRNGWIQIIADCDGWVSTGESGANPAVAERKKSLEKWGTEGGDGYVAAQQFPPRTPGPLEIAMEPSATCEVTVVDDKGQPVSNLPVDISVGDFFYPLSICYGIPRRTADQLRFSPNDIAKMLEKAQADGVPVTIEADYGNRGQAVTNAAGVATIRNLPASTVGISVQHETLEEPNHPPDLTLKSGETLRTKLTLQPKPPMTPGQIPLPDLSDVKKDELLGGLVTRNFELPYNPIVGLDFSNSQITDDELEKLHPLTHLKTLNLSDTHITDEGLAHLGKLTSLESLDLRNIAITDEGLEHLKGLTNLRTLELASRSAINPNITDAGLAHLKGLTKLVSLDLHGADVTTAGLKHLQWFKNLQQLLLRGPGIGDEGLDAIERLTSLERLSLYETSITDAAFVHLQKLTNLEALFFVRTQITGTGFEHLQGLTRLTAVQLSNSQVTDAGLESLAKLPGLKRIYLDETQISNAGLEHVRRMTTLEHLDLSRTAIGDNGLAQIRGMVGLKFLMLRRTKVTDAGLEQLKDLQHLESLELNSTEITDTGLQHLTELKSLRMLNLNNTQVTKDGRGKFRKALPKCEIATDPF